MPGSGPEIYMPMLNEFLERNQTGKLIILFYENDIYNLREAWWEGIEECSPPDFSSRIVRNDVSPSPDSPYGFFYYPPLKDSYLASKLYALLQKKPHIEKSELSMYNLYHSISAPALMSPILRITASCPLKRTPSAMYKAIFSVVPEALKYAINTFFIEASLNYPPPQKKRLPPLNWSY